MSVTFCIYDPEANRLVGEDDFVNLANDNARDLLEWLGLNDDPYLTGSHDADDLIARCRRRLWDVPRNHDPELPRVEERPLAHATYIFPGRRPGYLREKTQLLLELAEKAKEGGYRISWG